MFIFVIVGVVLTVVFVAYRRVPPNKPAIDNESTKAAIPKAVTEPAETIMTVIDLPRLAFAPQNSVSQALGKPVRVKAGVSMTTWREGVILDVTYHKADCTFLDGRLAAIEYRFAKLPQNVGDALVSTGFPRNALPSTPPYFAMYSNNRKYSNPIRCCGGLLFHNVSIIEDFTHIWVAFANVNLHFSEWPQETKDAWQLAGGPKLSLNPLDWPIEAKPRVKAAR